MILAFTGFAGSGKSTVCNHLVETKGFVKINFKDALVETMSECMQGTIQEVIKLMEKTAYDGWGWTEERLFQEKPPLFRALMQDVGTGIFRNKVGANYWVDQWKEKVREAMRQGLSVVTDDCRFLNEEKAVKDLGGSVIRIVRTDIMEAGKHQSETEQLQMVPDHQIVVAKGEHDKLYEAVDMILQELGYGE